jgi:hypothetical protein
MAVALVSKEPARQYALADFQYNEALYMGALRL